MFNDIISAFDDLVRQLPWMDEKTKQATLEKAKAMKIFAGYPDYFLQEGELEKDFEGVSIGV